MDRDLLIDYVWNGYLGDRRRVAIYGVEYRITYEVQYSSSFVSIICESNDTRIVLVVSGIDKSFAISTNGNIVYATFGIENLERDVSKYLPKSYWYKICGVKRAN